MAVLFWYRSKSVFFRCISIFFFSGQLQIFECHFPFRSLLVLVDFQLYYSILYRYKPEGNTGIPIFWTVFNMKYRELRFVQRYISIPPLETLVESTGRNKSVSALILDCYEELDNSGDIYAGGWFIIKYTDKLEFSWI